MASHTSVVGLASMGSAMDGLASVMPPNVLPYAQAYLEWAGARPEVLQNRSWFHLEGADPDAINKEMWTSFRGHNWKQDDMFWKMIHTILPDLLSYVGFMHMSEFQTKVRSRIKGDKIILDRFFFKAPPAGQISPRMPAETLTYETSTSKQYVNMYGVGFDIPPNWMQDPSLRSLHDMFTKAMGKSILRGIQYQVALRTITEGIAHRVQREFGNAAFTDESVLSKMLQRISNETFALNKAGSNLAGLENIAIATLSEDGFRPGLLLMTNRMLVTQRESNPATNTLSKVGVSPEYDASSKELIRPSKTPYFAIPIVMSQTLEIQDRHSKTQDATILPRYVSSRFLALPPVARGPSYYTHYNSRFRDVQLMDLDVGSLKTFSIMDWCMHQCMFGENGKLSAHIGYPMLSLILEETGVRTGGGFAKAGLEGQLRRTRQRIGGMFGEEDGSAGEGRFSDSFFFGGTDLAAPSDNRPTKRQRLPGGGAAARGGAESTEQCIRWSEMFESAGLLDRVIDLMMNRLTRTQWARFKTLALGDDACIEDSASTPYGSSSSSSSSSSAPSSTAKNVVYADVLLPFATPTGSAGDTWIPVDFEHLATEYMFVPYVGTEALYMEFKNLLVKRARDLYRPLPSAAADWKVDRKNFDEQVGEVLRHPIWASLVLDVSSPAGQALISRSLFWAVNAQSSTARLYANYTNLYKPGYGAVEASSASIKFIAAAAEIQNSPFHLGMLSRNKASFSATQQQVLEMLAMAKLSPTFSNRTKMQLTYVIRALIDTNIFDRRSSTFTADAIKDQAALVAVVESNIPFFLTTAQRKMIDAQMAAFLGVSAAASSAPSSAACETKAFCLTDGDVRGLLSSNVTEATTRFLYEHDLPIPWGFIIWAPWALHQTGTTTWLGPGAESVCAVVDQVQLLHSLDADSKNLNVQAAFTAGAIVVEPRSICVIPSTGSVRYEHGFGTKCIPLTRNGIAAFKAKSARFDGSLVPCLVPYGFRPARIYSDMTGTVSPLILEQGSASPAPECLTFPYLCSLLDIKHGKNHIFTTEGILRPRAKDQTICLRGAQKVFVDDGKGAGKMELDEIGQTAYGPNCNIWDLQQLAGCSSSLGGTGIQGSAYNRPALGGPGTAVA